MQDEPGAEILLDAIQDFLMKQVLPKMEGGDAYKTLVSWNALGIVARELRHEEGIIDGELETMTNLLCGEGDASTPLRSLDAKKEHWRDLNRRLVHGIRTRKLHVKHKDEWRLVKEMTANRIAVVNPRFKLN